MPSMILEIDSSYYQMQTPDSDMAAKWLCDLLILHKPDQSTRLILRVEPFWVRDPRGGHLPWIADWDDSARWTWSPYTDSPADAMRKFAGLIQARANELDPPALEEVPE